MSKQGCLTEGVSKVVLGRAALALVAKLQVSQNESRWVKLKTGETRCLQDFWCDDQVVYRERIQKQVDSPGGPVVFLCLQDNRGELVEDSQMSLTEMGKYVEIPDLKAGRKSG